MKGLRCVFVMVAGRTVLVVVVGRPGEDVNSVFPLILTAKNFDLALNFH